MKEIERFVIPLPPHERVIALEWRENYLRDIAGRRIYGLDGKYQELKYAFGNRFDQLISSKNGLYSIIFERLGTKGLILKEDFSILREINRSYYCSEVYEYPAAIFDLPDGRTVIAHCPDEYCRLEIEEIDSGERLTPRTSKPIDFFHSRLQASPDGKRLFSAGWIWHPLDWIQIYDTTCILESPELLDASSEHSFGSEFFEIHSAAFKGANQLVISGWDEDESKKAVGLYDLQTNQTLAVSFVDELVGEMMPVGDFIVAFYEYPKLIDLKSGQVVCRWNDLKSGQQNSSIIHHVQSLPAIALDPSNLRFAVAGSDSITVIQLGK